MVEACLVNRVLMNGFCSNIQKWSLHCLLYVSQGLECRHLLAIREIKAIRLEYLLFHLFAFRSTYLSIKKTKFLGGFSLECLSHQHYIIVSFSFCTNLSSEGKK